MATDKKSSVEEHQKFDVKSNPVHSTDLDNTTDGEIKLAEKGRETQSVLVRIKSTKEREQEKVKIQSAKLKNDITNNSASESKESEKKVPKLESENFRVDSSGWKKEKIDGIKFGFLLEKIGRRPISSEGKIEKIVGTFILINKERDITEFLDGEFKGEQLFTQAAMERETKKAGKTVPTIEQWLAIMESIDPEIKVHPNNTSVRKKLRLKFAGFRENGEFGNQGKSGYFWSSYHSNVTRMDGDMDGLFVHVNDSKVIPAQFGRSSGGLSVRCLED